MRTGTVCGCGDRGLVRRGAGWALCSECSGTAGYHRNPVAIPHPEVAPKGALIVVLAAVGNPDFQQYAAPAPAELASADTVQELVQATASYIRRWGLGGGNLWGVVIYNATTGNPVGRISYNGRVWPVAPWFSGQRNLTPSRIRQIEQRAAAIRARSGGAR